MIIITDKVIVLEEQILSVFLDIEEFLLEAQPDSHNVELKKYLGRMKKFKDLTFFGFYYTQDLNCFRIKDFWYLNFEDTGFNETIVDAFLHDENIDLRGFKKLPEELKNIE